MNPSTTYTNRAKRTAAALLLPLAMCIFLIAPGVANAQVYDTDTVGATTLASNAAIKAAAPDVTCGYGGLMTSDGKVLWSRGADTQVPMASTTKIMTAMVALEYGNLTDVIPVTQEAADTEGSTANLTAGDQLTLEQMLYAMMLPSGNDAATAIAQYYGAGDVNAFVTLMNQKAADLGMTSTHFSSPTGLDDTDNYTTVNDYLQLVKYAMSNQTFCNVVSTAEWSYTSTATGGTVTLESTDELLGSYDGILGIKTGFTDAAGYCFVGAAQRGNVELYVVVFDCPSEASRFSDASAILDWGFTHYHNVTVANAGDVMGKAVATDWLDKTVDVSVGQAVTALVFDYDPDLTTLVEINDRAGTIEQGSNMGTISWLQGENVVATTPLLASETVYSPGLFEKIQIGWSKFASIFTGDYINVEQSITAPQTFPLISAVA